MAILSGIRHSFNVVDMPDGDSILDDVEVDNYKSATCPEHCRKVEKQIIEEVENGRYIVTDCKA